MEQVQQGLIALLLLSILSLVLMVTLLLVFFVLRWRRQQESSHESTGFDNLKFADDAEASSFRSPAMRRPQTWLAIRSRNLEAVQTALALHNPKPCLWTDGLAGERRLFVAPPVSGWILVFGPALPEPDDDVDVCFRFLLNLSRKLGHVQYFSVNGVLNHHAWAHFESGYVWRGYAWAGKTIWNQGDMTREETALRMKCADYVTANDPSAFGNSDFGNAEKVHLLAARWSIDPEAIDESLMEHEWGIAGEPSHLF